MRNHIQKREVDSIDQHCGDDLNKNDTQRFVGESLFQIVTVVCEVIMGESRVVVALSLHLYL